MSAPANLVSAREFARLDGCDEKLVRRAIKSGKLSASADGKIDAALAGTGWRRQNRRPADGADQPADTVKVSAPGVRRSKVSAPTADEVAAAIERLADEDADGFLVDVLAGRFRGIVQAEQIKENALAAKHLIAARKDAGDLVERERAEKIFFETARSWRDIWIGFPARVGPLLAADLDLETDKVVEALTIHVQQQLEQLGEPQGNFAAQEE